MQITMKCASAVQNGKRVLKLCERPPSAQRVQDGAVRPHGGEGQSGTSALPPCTRQSCSYLGTGAVFDYFLF